jgi:hypothetical protein
MFYESLDIAGGFPKIWLPQTPKRSQTIDFPDHNQLSNDFGVLPI